MTKQWTLLAVASLTPAAALADAPPPNVVPPLPVTWSGDASIGYIRTTGNTDSSAINGKANLDWKSEPWENHFHAQGAYSSSLGLSTAESYQAADKLNYDLDPAEYLFGSLEFDDDRFAGVVSHYSESAGYGRHLVKTPLQTLDVDVGVGLSQSREEGDTGYDGQLIGVFNLNYLFKFAPNAKFKQTLHVEGGIDNVYINPVSELKLTVIGNVFATLGYDWRHNTSVPEGSVHTDTITTVNFGYTFGKKPS
jgi:putative salt-induced outer membrane protein